MALLLTNQNVAFAEENIPLTINTIPELDTRENSFYEVGGHIYYPYVDLIFGGKPNNTDYYYEYDLSESGGWRALAPESNRVRIEEELDGKIIAVRLNSPTKGHTNTTTHSKSLYIDPAPELENISLVVTNTSENNYEFEFSFDVASCITGVRSIELLTPFGKQTLPSDANSFNITSASNNSSNISGEYWFVVTNMTGAVSYTSFHADCTVPQFKVLPQSGADISSLENPDPKIWASFAIFLFSPDAIPAQGMEIQYRFKPDEANDYGAWENIGNNYQFSITPNVNGLIQFKAVSLSTPGVEYVLSNTFRTYTDAVIPALAISSEDKNRNGEDIFVKVDDEAGGQKFELNDWTNKDIKLSILMFQSGPSGGSIKYLTNDAVAPHDWNADNPFLVEPGIYKFYAVSGAGNESDKILIDLSKLDKTPPVISGATKGQTYYSDVKLIVSGFVPANTTSYLNGDPYKIEFDEAGSALFTENGFYLINVFDAAGNAMEITFTLEKPDVFMIVLLVMLSFIGFVVILVLIIAYQRKSKALKKFESDASGGYEGAFDYLLYKRIRKGKITGASGAESDSFASYGLKPKSTISTKNIEKGGNK
jgi:adenine-specific DNA methylase